jgi:hypothetical protein
MNTLVISKDYKESLEKNKPIYIREKVQPHLHSLKYIRTIPTTPVLSIPALKFNMMELEKIKPFILLDSNKFQVGKIPEVFDWRHSYITDTEEISIKKQSQSISIQSDMRSRNIFIKGDKITQQNFSSIVKQNIYLNGPVLGGFVVFNNFLSGEFSKVNGGVYLEKGVYDKSILVFDDEQVSGENYRGTHSVGVIGWGVARKIVVDNEGNREDVPFWYAQNSWTRDWGDGGYFKIAMYPWNKLSQFDSKIKMKTPTSEILMGGMMINPGVNPADINVEFYEKSIKTKKSGCWRSVLLFCGLIIILFLVVMCILKNRKK